MDQFVEILQLPIRVLRQRIQEELQENPVLELQSLSTDDEIVDIVVKRTETGVPEVRVLDDWMLKISISQRYLDLSHDESVDPKAKEYLRRKIQAAQSLREAVEHRRHVLEKVAQTIFRRQRAFLDQEGPGHIVPLSPQQLADEAGVPVTTVLWALQEKQVRTPNGVFALDHFVLRLPRPSDN
jgi:RNA polymerase sigma-54 factor